LQNKDDLLAAQIGAAIKAFRSEFCPSCEGEKVTLADPFCIQCYERLPMDYQDALRDRSRFIELFHPAMAHLLDP